MIRVNLLRSISPSSGVSIGAQPGITQALSSDHQKQLVLRVVFLCLCLVGLYVFEQMQLQNKRDELMAQDQKVKSVAAQRAKFGDTAPIVKKFEERRDKLDALSKILEKLTENRLSEVKTLDAIQSLTPQNAWLSDIMIEGGKVTMIGYASDVLVTGAISTNLKNNVLFNNVKISSQEVQVADRGSVQKFDCKFQIGKPR